MRSRNVQMTVFIHDGALWYTIKKHVHSTPMVTTLRQKLEDKDLVRYMGYSEEGKGVLSLPSGWNMMKAHQENKQCVIVPTCVVWGLVQSSCLYT